MMGRFLFFAFFAAAQLSAQPAVKQYGGWIAGCDNENICTAILPVRNAIDGSPVDDAMPFLQIRHHPQRDATPEIMVMDQSNPAPDAISKPPLAGLSIYFKRDCKCKGDCPDTVQFYQSQNDGKGRYRFKDDDARSVLYGLRRGSKVEISLSHHAVYPLDTAELDEALAHFDRAQDVDGTPGGLVLRPTAVMFDYAHPIPPEAETVILTAFNDSQLNSWRAEYPKRMPAEPTTWETDPERGTILLIRAQSPDGDCGILESWGHVGAENDFALIERREMPVCNGIAPSHWIQTYRANTISPD